MPALLDKLQKDMTAAGIRPRTAAAQQWLFSKLRKIRITADRSNVLVDARRVAPKAYIGKMYFFNYDAKWKDILPVWDRFPLVIPTDLYSDGFLGLNLHYVDPYTRLLILDRLHDFINNTKYDDTTTFRLSYDLLSKGRRYKLLAPCYKRYLFEHIVSPLVYVEPDSWENAIFLPLAKMVYRKE